MKHIILTVALAVACTLGHAQSTNPLNYGGKMYVEHNHWVVVIYMDLVDEGDKAELVWPEFGKPLSLIVLLIAPIIRN